VAQDPGEAVDSAEVGVGEEEGLPHHGD